MKPSEVLVFGAHPDDREVGCGGSLIRHANAGHLVRSVIMTSGEEGGRPANTEKRVWAAMRENEDNIAGNVLGIKNTLYLQQPDGFLEYNKRILEGVIKIIRNYMPDIIYMNHRIDDHKDHQATYAIVSEAIKRAGSCNFPDLGPSHTVRQCALYEVWSPLEKVNAIANIRKEWERKICAVLAHKTQVDNNKDAGPLFEKLFATPENEHKEKFYVCGPEEL